MRKTKDRVNPRLGEKVAKHGSLRSGRTIVAKRDLEETASERLLARKKSKNKKTFMTIATTIVLFIIFIFMVMTVRSWMQPRQYTAVVSEKYDPTIEIIDEDSSDYITDRMKEYVGKVERDFRDLGYTVTKAIIPTGKTREIDIYIDGRTEYYKMNLDRGTAVSVEDAVHMINYLESSGIEASYVDVRIAGKAFFK